MKRFFEFGNRLHSGETSIPFVQKGKLWVTIAGVLAILSLLVPVLGGFNLGIDFRGGSEFEVSNLQDNNVQTGIDAVDADIDNAEARGVPRSDTSVRIETRQLSDEEMQTARESLVSAYGVAEADVTSNFVGPLWGSAITEKMVRALVIFVVISMIVMALYFRTWKMSLAAIVGLFFVMIVTMGIYSASGFEVTPEAIIGFLTVLSFSLYDTVVVFDKIRENTADFEKNRKQTFGELVNLGVNQTTVRSINTTIISILPIGAILFIGVFMLGAGTLVDISLSLFVGTIVAAASTLFVASPLYYLFRKNEKAVKHQEEAVLAARAEHSADKKAAQPA